MNTGQPTSESKTEAREVARQAEIEIGIALGIEQSLRIALQWATRGRGNGHKLSTLRFHTWSFERHLTRIQALADHGGYMHVITVANPHLAGQVRELEDAHISLHADLQGIIIRLDLISRDDGEGFGLICADLERFLDDLRAHGQKERELLQHSLIQDEGESG